MINFFFFSICLSIVLNLLILVLFEKIKKIINIYDLPDKRRKLHKEKVPLYGGIIILINLFFCFLLPIILLGKINDFYSIYIFDYRQLVFF